METVNIPASVSDPYYRYKREVCIAIYKPINGGVTVISNLETVAHQLGREIKDIISYLKKKLGTRNTGVQFSGIHSVGILEQHLENYIREFILCLRCKNPETVTHKKKTRCKACGHSYSLI